MKRFKAAAIVVGLLSSAAMLSPAYAARTFDWSLTGPAASLGGIPLPESGQLTATQTSTTGVWTVDTLTVGNSNINRLTTPTSANDNLIYTNGFAVLDTTGIVFDTPAGQSIKVFSFDSQGTPPTGNAYGEIATPGGFGVGTFALAVPEPATWAMLLLGFFGLGYAVRSARRKDVAAAA